MSLFLKKAMFEVDGVSEPIEVMFNPNEYTVSKKVKKSDRKTVGKDKQKKQFLYGYNDTLVLKLFYDTYSTGLVNSMLPEAAKKDVREETKKIYDLLNVSEHIHTPPKVKFVWGKFKFEGYLVSITQNFTMFTFRGVPVRATMEVTIEGDEVVEKTLSSPDRTKSHTVVGNEQLWQLADREYDDAGLWRKIAEANGIDNPRAVKSAMNLKIPSL